MADYILFKHNIKRYDISESSLWERVQMRLEDEYELESISYKTVCRTRCDWCTVLVLSKLKKQTQPHRNRNETFKVFCDI